MTRRLVVPAVMTANLQKFVVIVEVQEKNRWKTRELSVRTSSAERARLLILHRLEGADAAVIKKVRVG